MKRSFSLLKAMTLFNALLTLLSFIVPFAVSADWAWWQAWVWFAICLVSIAVSRIVALRLNPDLAKERFSAAEQSNTQGWDKWIVPFIGVYLPLIQVVIAGLDHRFHWSAQLPLLVIILGLLLLLLGYSLGTWAMAVNTYFSSYVRLQPERGQIVVNKGPYRIMRHPAYSGGILGIAGIALLLGSWWAFIPALLYTILVLVRTGMEDRFLTANLAGYAEYARTTRFRLMPGIW